jgi:hypothetical protein
MKPLGARNHNHADNRHQGYGDAERIPPSTATLVTTLRNLGGTNREPIRDVPKQSTFHEATSTTRNEFRESNFGNFPAIPPGRCSEGNLSSFADSVNATSPLPAREREA